MNHEIGQKVARNIPEAMTVVQTASVLSDCNHHQLPRAKKFHKNQIPDLDLVLQKKDKAIHWINHYPTDTCSAVGFANTYPLDGHLSGR